MISFIMHDNDSSFLMFERKKIMLQVFENVNICGIDTWSLFNLSAILINIVNTIVLKVYNLYVYCLCYVFKVRM